MVYIREREGNNVFRNDSDCVTLLGGKTSKWLGNPTSK